MENIKFDSKTALCVDEADYCILDEGGNLKLPANKDIRAIIAISATLPPSAGLDELKIKSLGFKFVDSQIKGELTGTEVKQATVVEFFK